MDLLDYITSDPKICHGQTCIRGTRILVSAILGCIADGMSEDAILEQYPMLTHEGIRAAAAYGALLAGEELARLPVSAGE